MVEIGIAGLEALAGSGWHAAKVSGWPTTGESLQSSGTSLPWDYHYLCNTTEKYYYSIISQ